VGEVVEQMKPHQPGRLGGDVHSGVAARLIAGAQPTDQGLEARPVVAEAALGKRVTRITQQTDLIVLEAEVNANQESLGHGLLLSQG